MVSMSENKGQQSKFSKRLLLGDIVVENNDITNL